MEDAVRYQLREYVEGDISPFAKWFRKLAPVAAARIDKYLRRMEQGNMGDSKSVGGDVKELRIDCGPGYRVYYGCDGELLIILLAGGSKRGQAKDISEARARWARYKRERGRSWR